MRRGNILPIALMAFTIMAFLFVVDYAVSGGKWPWATNENETKTINANKTALSNSSNVNVIDTLTTNSNTISNTNIDANPTADWKTYTNNQAGFSIQYNNLWFPHEDDRGVTISEKKDFDLFSPDPNQAQISVYKYDLVDARGNAMTADQWIKKNLGIYFIRVTVNGLPMIRVIDRSGPGLAYYYFTDSSYYHLYQYPYVQGSHNTNDFEAYIKTFSFIK